jgi:hypothetical protein
MLPEQFWHACGVAQVTEHKLPGVSAHKRRDSFFGTVFALFFTISVPLPPRKLVTASDPKGQE